MSKKVAVTFTIEDLFRIAFVDGVLDLSRHKRMGIPLKDAQAGTGAEIDPLATIHGAGIVGWVFQFAFAGGLCSGGGVAVVD